MRTHPKSEKKTDSGRAALLWKLIGPTGRTRVAAELEPAEIEAANHAFEIHYRTRPAAERRAIEQSLRRYLGDKHGPVPMLISLVLGILAAGLIVFQMIEVPAMSLHTRSALFTPLLLTVLAPLTLYLLPPYRLFLLFRPALSFRAAGTAVLTYVALLWTLYFRDVQQGSHLQLDWLSQTILLIGAFGAPLLEELIFRELIPTFFGRPPHYFGHFVGMTAFALAHFPLSPGMFALYFIAAFALAEVRIQSDGLLYGTLAHALANCTILLVL